MARTDGAIGLLAMMSGAPSRCDHPIMAQKRVELRRTPPEGDERLERCATAATREHLVAETAADFRRQDAVLLEELEGVRRQHFGPFVAVVSSRVTAGEHVSERVHEAVV